MTWRGNVMSLLAFPRAATAQPWLRWVLRDISRRQAKTGRLPGMKYLTAIIAALAQGITALPPISTITFNQGANKSTINAPSAAR